MQMTDDDKLPKCFGGPSIDEVAEATQTGFVLKDPMHEWLTSLPPEKVAKLLGESIHQHAALAWHDRANALLAELDGMTDMYRDVCRKLTRVRVLMEDPDPYRQDLGPDGTFNVPCVLVSDLKEALDG